MVGAAILETEGEMTDPALRELTVVVVAHNSGAVIGPCLKSLAHAGQVIVVDNASDDNTLARARVALPSVEIIANSVNMGFGTANNIGFEASRTLFTLLLNPDTVVPTGALEHLLATAKAYPDAAVIAPLLKNPDSALELYLMGLGEKTHHRQEASPDGNLCTGFIMGAAMLWRMDAWQRLGGFDEAIFIYGEDTDIALRATEAGYSLVVTPGAEIYHLGGQSDPPTRHTRWRKAWHMTYGHLYVKAKHGEEVAAREEAQRLRRYHSLKALLYLIVIRPRKMLDNLARALAASAFLGGRPSWPGRQ